MAKQLSWGTLKAESCFEVSKLVEFLGFTNPGLLRKSLGYKLTMAGSPRLGL